MLRLFDFSLSRSWIAALSLGVIVSHAPLFARADDSTEPEPLLQDFNLDGKISVLAFGDSITFGLGDDGIPLEIRDPGQGAHLAGRLGKGGYPQRLSTLLGIEVRNAGIPGEEILVNGAKRFAGTLASNPSDVVVVLEGANDALHRADSELVKHGYQKMANVARVLDRKLVFMNLARPTGDHAGLPPYVDSFNKALNEIVFLNDLQIIDINKTWRTTCSPNEEDCNLYNLPDGLHPNATGYDAIAQTASATFIGIDIFAPNGAVDLEKQLNLPAGTVIVKPGV